MSNDTCKFSHCFCQCRMSLMGKNDIITGEIAAIVILQYLVTNKTCTKNILTTNCNKDLSALNNYDVLQ